MIRLTALTSIIALALTVGCGSSSQSPQDAIRSTSRAYIAALKSDHVGDACRLTTNQQDCLGTVATLKAAGIKPSDALSGNEERNIKAMQITVNGNRAHSSTDVDYVKRDGEWLIVLKDQ